MKKETSRYVAFLRGINVGGNKPIKMIELIAMFDSMGFTNVKTVLASGNVVFDAAAADPNELRERIEATLEKTLGHEVRVVVRSSDEIRTLVDAQPFAKTQITPSARLYVTFMREPSDSAKRLRNGAEGGTFTIVRATSREVCTALELSPGFQTTELMSYLEKSLGTDVTTRNWNTIERVLAL